MPLILGFDTPAVFLLVDFNMVPCPDVNRMGGGARVGSALAQWVSTFALVDVWRHLHPASREFSCHSAFCKSLSCIDLAYASSTAVQWVVDASILP